MTKEMLIKHAKEIATQQNMEFVFSKLGRTQFRTLAELSQKACFEELKLLLEYKIAKGNGWDQNVGGGRMFGSTVIKKIELINEECKGGYDEFSDNASRFFGYLHWISAALVKFPEMKL